MSPSEYTIYYKRKIYGYVNLFARIWTYKDIIAHMVVSERARAINRNRNGMR